MIYGPGGGGGLQNMAILKLGTKNEKISPVFWLNILKEYACVGRERLHMRSTV